VLQPLDQTVATAIAHAEGHIRGYGDRALVAFSGGVDSSVVLALASRALGPENTEAVTAISPSYAAGELEVAARTARALGVVHRTIETHEVEREAYLRNDALRCFHCKAELYGVLGRIASTAGPSTVVLAGANADDVGEFRPGLWAGERAGIRNPLLERSLGKDVTRGIARALGLAVSEKPALACLSSRVELGIRITPELLGRIDRAENVIRSLGFDLVRVRHQGLTATIEVASAEIPRLEEHPSLGNALREIRALGWSDVRIDRRGYRPAGAMAT
jgi:uncharacterized protein